MNVISLAHESFLENSAGPFQVPTARLCLPHLCDLNHLFFQK